MVLPQMDESAYHLLPKWSDHWYNMNYRIGTKCTIPHSNPWNLWLNGAKRTHGCVRTGRTIGSREIKD